MSFEVIKIERISNNLVKFYGPDNVLIKSVSKIERMQPNRGYVELYLEDGLFRFNVYKLTSLVNLTVTTPYSELSLTGTPIETYMAKFNSVYARLIDEILAGCCCDAAVPGDGTYQEVATYGDLPGPGSSNVLYYVVAQNAYYFWDGASYQPTDKVISGTSTGTDTYAITGSSTVIGYSQGVIYKVKTTNANTGPSTWDWDGVGPAPVIKNESDPLVAGDLPAGSIRLASFDGTSFRILGGSSGGGGGTVMSVTSPTPGVVDNTDPANPIINADLFGSAAAAQAAAEAYADALVVGLWDDRGNYDASVNAYPSSGGSGTAGAILKGDIWTISVGGTLPTGQVVVPGDTVRALIDTPGNTQANWAIAETNIGYVPENQANKTGTLTGDYSTGGSATEYPSGVGTIEYGSRSSWKFPVKGSSTANLVLSGLQAIDGVTYAAGEAILVRHQSAPAENGIYLQQAGAWTRRMDADTLAKLNAAFVRVIEGTLYAGTVWKQDTANPVIGVSAILWTQFGAAVNADVQIFTAGGTWTKPTGAKKVFVVIVGAGGGGGSGPKSPAATNSSGGGAGGGGGISRRNFEASLLPASVAITVAAGGVGGAAIATNSTNGIAGGAGTGTSAFGVYMKANNGGGGAAGNTPSTTATAGAGGAGNPSGGASGSNGGAGGSAGGGNSATPADGTVGGGGGGGVTAVGGQSVGGNGNIAQTWSNAPTLTNNRGNTGGPKDGGPGDPGLEIWGYGGGGGAGSNQVGINAGNGGAGGAYGGGGGGGGAANDTAGNSGAGGNGHDGVVIVTTIF